MRTRNIVAGAAVGLAIALSFGQGQLGGGGLPRVVTSSDFSGSGTTSNPLDMSTAVTLPGSLSVATTTDFVGDISDSNSDVKVADGLNISGTATMANTLLTLGTNGVTATIAMRGAAGSNINFRTSTAGGADQSVLTLAYDASATVAGNIISSAGNITAAAGTVSAVNLTATGALSVGAKATATGADPTLSSCGTSPTIVGSDLAGIVTVGTGGPTSCTITFSSTYTATPSCQFSSDMTAAIYYSAKSATAVTVTSVGGGDLSGKKIDYNCWKM